jgi:hypothetical protein
MKYLFVLMFLASCATATQPKKEPWAVGDCVAWKPRALIGKIHEVIPPSESGRDEYFYGIQYFAEEKKDKILEVIPCPTK